MRARRTVSIVLVAAVAASFVYTAAATNPKSLVLQRSDVPAGAKRVSYGSTTGAIKLPRSVHGRAAYVGWRFRNGGRTETVAAAAGILRSTRDAHAVYVKAKKTITAKGRAFKPLSLPRYGSEQFARGASFGPVGAGVVFVRSGARLWEVIISGYPSFPRSSVVSELKKYAAKEKARAS
jgi:hypothetical protein